MVTGNTLYNRLRHGPISPTSSISQIRSKNNNEINNALSRKMQFSCLLLKRGAERDYCSTTVCESAGSRARELSSQRDASKAKVGRALTVARMLHPRGQRASIR